MSLFLRLVFNLTEIEAMRGDGGTPRGLRAQQTYSRAAGGTTNYPSRRTHRRTRNQKDNKSTQSADVITAGGSTQHDPSRQNQPAKNQTNGRRAKQIRRAIKKYRRDTNGRSTKPNKIRCSHEPPSKLSNTTQSSNHLTPSNHQNHPTPSNYQTI